MKNTKKICIGLLLLFIPLSFLIASETQETKILKSRMKLEYFNKTGEKSLVATLTSRVGRTTKKLENLDVNFYTYSDTTKILLETKQTNQSGQATIHLLEDINRTDGIFKFEASFEGTKDYTKSTKEIEIKDVQMKISFAQENGDKKINVKVTENSDEDNPVPVNDEIVNFYVPRTFTLLPIGEEFLEEGNSSIDFPVTLPGDTMGYLTVVAKIEDHDVYGNIEAIGKINWGKPLARFVEVKRGLGDTNAPLWMVYTLIVLLSTVWFHYLYTIYSIYLIKKEGKKPDATFDD